MKDSMYKLYLEELYDGKKSLVEDEHGFASYHILGEECYIEDIYVKPESRRGLWASSYADIISDIARKQGCKYLTGSVVPGAVNTQISVKMMFGYGFEIFKTTNEAIYFIKEL